LVVVAVVAHGIYTSTDHRSSWDRRCI
jgi:hypothetical protein